MSRVTDGGDGKARGERSAETDDADAAEASLGGRSRSITLTLSAPVLMLPGEEVADIARPASVRTPPTPSNLDAWSLDKLRRSSLPPAMAQRAVSTAFPPPPRTPMPEASDASEDGGALSLVGRSPVPPPYAADLLGEVSDRFALGDYTGALRVAELILGQDPAHDLAQHYARSSRDKLEAMYSSRLLGGATVIELALPEPELRWLGLDPQVAALLARVDGRSDVESVIAASGVPRLEALRALVELLEGKVVRLV